MHPTVAHQGRERVSRVPRTADPRRHAEALEVAHHLGKPRGIPVHRAQQAQAIRNRCRYDTCSCSVELLQRRIGTQTSRTVSIRRATARTRPCTRAFRPRRPDRNGAAFALATTPGVARSSVESVARSAWSELLHELDRRSSDRIDVALLWHERDHRVLVAVADGRTGARFEIEVREDERRWMSSITRSRMPRGVAWRSPA